jgi:flavin-dependent dehydrogenase
MKSDVVIIGGGPSGSASALFLQREGIRPLIVEREAFPRYHIGESLTGAAGKVLRELGLEDEMVRRGYPSKQGVKVFGQSERISWFVPVTGRDENWKLFPWTTWQVRRSDFDALMLDRALAGGSPLVRGQAVGVLKNARGDVAGIRVRMADGALEEIHAELVLDCSGQATWLAGHGGVTGPKYLGAYDKQIAIFSQVRAALRENGGTRETHPDNTLIFYQKKYHWAWFIPIDSEIVSVGVVIPAAYFLEKHESKRDFLTRELRELHPELKRRIPEVEFAEDVHVIPNYSYQVRGFAGRGFLCVGDAHRFLDPIFSFGVTVALREAQIAAPVIKAYLNGAHRDAANPFADYQLACEVGIDILEDVLDCFWEQPFTFATFVHARYTEHMTDMFAGRIYERQPSPALHGFRAVLKRQRTYDGDDSYSIPIGSRYHPERAPLWQAGSEVESTESWMGPR